MKYRVEKAAVPERDLPLNFSLCFRRKLPVCFPQKRAEFFSSFLSQIHSLALADNCSLNLHAEYLLQSSNDFALKKAVASRNNNMGRCLLLTTNNHNNDFAMNYSIGYSKLLKHSPDNILR